MHIRVKHDRTLFYLDNKSTFYEIMWKESSSDNIRTFTTVGYSSVDSTMILTYILHRDKQKRQFSLRFHFCVILCYGLCIMLLTDAHMQMQMQMRNLGCSKGVSPHKGSFFSTFDARWTVVTLRRLAGIVCTSWIR